MVLAIKHLFFVETELQALSAIAIVRTEFLSEPLFLVTSKSILKYLTEKGYSVEYVGNRPRGWFGRFIGMLELTDQVCRYGYMGSLTLYVARLDTFLCNVLVGSCLKRLGINNVDICLLPDGSLNLIKEDASERWNNESRNWLKKIAYGFFGRLALAEIYGERIGADMDVVKRIYCFNGLGEHYPENKKIQIPSFNDIGDSTIPNTAIVVGQPLSRAGAMQDEIILNITQAIKNYLDSVGVDKVLFAPHPRSDKNELMDEAYGILEHDSLCLEEYLQDNPAAYIVSCSSTVLFNAKLMYGNSIESVAVGIEHLQAVPESLKGMMESYSNIGVRLLPVPPLD
ncbi:MAG: hypothetical protein CMI09_16365 [Oceanospirillaceae bacterium]|nr:hypothetical protein [Oceanospirillaceae bacterium]